MISDFYRKLFLLGGRQVYCNRKDCWTNSHPVFLLVCQANKESWTNYLVCYQCYLRPITLTSQLAKIFEGFMLAPLYNQVIDKIDLKQFALPGRSATHALVYLLPCILEALDNGHCYALISCLPTLAKHLTWWIILFWYLSFAIWGYMRP